MTGNKVGSGDIVAGADGLRAKPQMGDGDAAGLLGVILEVGLCVKVGVVTDDLNGVLVGANGAVRAEAPEFTCGVALGLTVGIVGDGQAQVGHVIVDAQGKGSLRLVLHEVQISGDQAAGAHVLGAEAVTAADNGNRAELGAGQCSDHVQIQRLAQSAGFLAAIQNGNALYGFGQNIDQILGAAGAVQMYIYHADLLAGGVQIIADFHQGVTGGAHGDHDVLGIGSAIVVEGLVVGAQLFVDLVHILDHDAGDLIIMRIAGLTGLEEDIGVLCRALDMGMVGVQCGVPEGLNLLLVQHFVQIRIVPYADLLDLMGGAEAVEEVQEGGGAFNGRKMCDRSQIHDLLRVRGCQHGKAGAAACHYVAVIAEDGQGVGGKGTGGYMHDAGEILCGDFIHVGDHQEQTLGCGKGCSQCAGHQASVYSALGLHFGDFYRLTEEILPACGSPLVNMLCHDRGGGDGINCGNIGKRIGHMCGGIIAVHGFQLSSQSNSSLNRLGVNIYSFARRESMCHDILTRSSFIVP